MNEAAASKPGAYAHIRVREPAGERALGASVSVGGEGGPEAAEVIVPGAPAGVALTVERREGDWFAVPQSGASVRFDGRPLSSARELHKDDVLSVGDAQILVLDDSRTRLRLDVQHLVGNQTIPPVVTVAAVDVDSGDEDIEIRVIPSTIGDRPAAALLTAERTQRSAGGPRKPLSRKAIVAIGASLAVLAIVTLFLSSLQTVEVDVRPEDANIST